jgi:mRNA interferase RelE/StbE
MWSIELTEVAVSHLTAISDRQVQRQIAARIDWLAEEPEKKGKPLRGELAGLYSVRAAGQRYRIIYGLDQGRVIVYVVALGIRKEGDRTDIFSLAQKLVASGLIRTDR